MAAADYYLRVPRPKEEERLNIQARFIAQRTLLFQAQLRGFLVRKRMYEHIWRSDSVKKHGSGDIYCISNEVSHKKRNAQTGQISNCNIEKGVRDIPPNRIYPLISCQGGTSGEAISKDLRTERPEPIDSLTNHCESGNHNIPKARLLMTR